MSEFFLQLSNAITDRAVELEAAGENVTDEQLQEEISDYAETLTEQTDDISADLEDLGFELIVLLDYHDSWQLHTARRLDVTYENELSETATEALDESEDLFLELDAARDYLKTLWVQRELAELSRMMLYTGLPAVIVAGLGIFIAQKFPVSRLHARSLSSSSARPSLSRSYHFRSFSRASCVLCSSPSERQRSAPSSRKTNSSESAVRSRRNHRNRMSTDREVWTASTGAFPLFAMNRNNSTGTVYMSGFGRISVLHGNTGVAEYPILDLAFEDLSVLFAPIPEVDSLGNHCYLSNNRII